MENIRNSGVSRNQITSKYTYLRNSLEFRVVLESCERILTLGPYLIQLMLMKERTMGTKMGIMLIVMVSS